VADEDRRALRDMLAHAIAVDGREPGPVVRLRHLCADGTQRPVEVKACFDGEFIHKLRATVRGSACARCAPVGG
jgi:hypothetical protein